MNRCRETGCRRAASFPDQAFCREHQPKWVPEWRKRLVAKDYTRSAA